MRPSKFILILPIFFLFSCSTLVPAPLHVKIASANGLNPDEHQRSLAVVVRVYQLVDADSFQSASFEELWKHDARVLGNQRLRQQEWVILPGQRTERLITLHPETHYLGIIALFRRPRGQQWKAIRPVSAPTSVFTSPVELVLRGQRVEVRR